MFTALQDQRLRAAKQAFSTRRIPKTLIDGYIDHPHTPEPGDLVLARVEQLGRLQRLESPDGRRCRLYEGDEILVTYGNRYAPDAYEALIPKDLGRCHLAAAGGLASTVVATNTRFADEDRPPTTLLPIGICVDRDGMPINLKHHTTAPIDNRFTDVPVIIVFGSSMNSGKTTTAAGIIRGLANHGRSVGAAKITGTCAGGDLWKFKDAGATQTYDFTDVGMATTYREDIDRIVRGAEILTATLEDQGCDVIVLEIADGLHQAETAALLGDAGLRAIVDHWVYAADSASSVALGVQLLRDIGITITCVSGSVTASPLAIREAIGLTYIPILDLDRLECGDEPMLWIEPSVPSHLHPVPYVGSVNQLAAL